MNVKRKELLDVLETVKPGLANKEIIEQSSTFAFLGDRVATYNAEISISCQLKQLNLSGAVDATELYKLLNKLKKDDVDISIVDKELLVQCGRSKAGIRLQTDVTLPLEDVGDADNFFEVPTDFLSALRFVLPTCGKNNTEPILTCVHLTNNYVESSDNYKIARYKFEKQLQTENDYLIPASSVTEILKLEPDMMSIGDGKGWVHFKASDKDYLISCRIMSGNYPEISPFLNIGEGIEVVLPQTLPDALERAGVFTEDFERQHGRVGIEINGNKIKVLSECASGWYEEEINMIYEGEPIKFEIIPSFLQSIMQQTRACNLKGNRIKFRKENWEYLSSLIISE